MSSPFNKFDQFVGDLAHQVHDFKTGSSHVFNVMLTNTSPVVSNSVFADLVEITAANGYTAGGFSAGTVTGSQSAGLFTFKLGSDVTVTASGGNIGPFQWVVLYNDTPTSPADPLIGWWDLGAPLTLTPAISPFTIDLDQTNGIFTIQ